MRIACLQFAPQVGEVDANVDRAEAILDGEKDSLENLDLLVLPEMALTGYNFTSLEHISPYLEHCGSGLSYTWAHATAKKHDCLVALGYPETVDVADRWPADPEYYNSATIVNKHGEVLTNYRKTFLYYTDETWALEGDEGFFEGYIPKLGNAAYGICMDLNPYKFEAPWTNYEFGVHVVQSRSNVVIVSMAWMTRENAGDFLRTPKQPDLDTLTYWVSRLEPVLRVDGREEVIVIFCNRCGTEDEVVYAGTSAVIGIQDGEVRVYGVLGRGEEKLLVVDTSKPPQARLVAQPAPTSTADLNNEDAHGGVDEDDYSAPRDPSSSPQTDEPARDPQISKTETSHQQDAENITPTSLRKGKLSDLHKLSTGFSIQTGRPQSLEFPTPIAPSPTPMYMRPQLETSQPSKFQSSNGISPEDDGSHMSMSSHSKWSDPVNWTDVRPQDSASHLASAFGDDSPSGSASQSSRRVLRSMASPGTHSQTSSSRDDLLIDFDTPDGPVDEPGSETVSAVYRHGLSELHSPPPDYSAVVGASFRVPRMMKGLQSYRQRTPSRVGTETSPMRLKTFRSMSDLRQESVTSAPPAQDSREQSQSRKKHRHESITIRQREGTPIQLPARPQSVNTGQEISSANNHRPQSMVSSNLKAAVRPNKTEIPAKSSPGISQSGEPQESPRGLGIVSRGPSRTTSRPTHASGSGSKSNTPDPTPRGRRRMERHRSRADSFQWPSQGSESSKHQVQTTGTPSRNHSTRDPRETPSNVSEINRNQAMTPTTFATLSLLSKKQAESEGKIARDIPAHWLDALEGTGLTKEAKARAEKEAIACLQDMEKLKRTMSMDSQTSNTLSKIPRSKADGLAKIEIYSVDTLSPESPTTPGSALKTPKAMVLFNEIDEALSNAVMTQQEKRASVIRYVDRRSLKVTS